MDRCIITMFVLISTIIRGGHMLVFECYPDMTIKVENPSNFTSVFANNSVTLCTTRWTEGKTHVFIDDCDMDDDILLFFSNLEPDFNHVIGGTETGNATYIINCKQIPLTGQMHVVHAAAEVSLGEKNTSEYHTINVDSNLYSGIINKTVVREAYLGTPLFWIIEIKMAGFDLRPEECWAYAGKGVHDKVPRRLLITEGCTHNDELVEDFMNISSSKESMIMAIFYSFQFISSDYVTLNCKILICARPSTACDIDCSNKRRRRRSTQDNWDQADDNKGGNSYRFINSQIRVTNSSAIPFGSANIWSVFAWLVLRIL